MEDRNIVDKCNGILSEVKNITLGVSQISVLDPLRFLLFSNDLPQYISSVNSREEYQGGDESDWKCSNRICWCQRNRLILNASKSIEMYLHLVRAIPTEQDTLKNIQPRSRVLGLYHYFEFTRVCSYWVCLCIYE